MKRSGWYSLAAIAALLIGGVAPSAYAAVPANDLIADAVAVTALPYSDSSSTVEATTTGEPTDCMTSPAIWYKYTPTAAISVQADTIGSGFDTKLAIYQGKPRSSSAAIACDDDGGGYPASLIAISLAPRVTYYIMVGGYGDFTGSTVFNLTQKTDVPSWSVVTSATVNGNGALDVTGSFTCAENTTGTLDWVDFRQVFRDGSEAWGYLEPAASCGTTFTGTVFPASSTVFARGKVEVAAYTNVYTSEYAGGLYQASFTTIRVPLAR